jgi:hypothetical protein
VPPPANVNRLPLTSAPLVAGHIDLDACGAAEDQRG